MKRCPTCGLDKPLDQFGKNRARKDGVQSLCKLCESAKHKLIYKPKKPPVPVSARTAASIANGKRKICRRCGAAKALNSFYNNLTKKDGKQSYCISCMSNGSRKSYRRKIEREKVAAVAGKMLPWQAAEKLGVSEDIFHYLAQKHGLSTAFLKLPWSEQEEGELLLLRMQGLTHKAIAEHTGRSLGAVKMKLRELRNR